MAYAPLTKIPQQFFDNLGNPLVSGTLYAYLAGTSTPTNMFSDNAGTVAGTSVVLDSRGEPTTFKLIWLNTTIIYKFVLKDSTGTTIWTIDNISGDDGTGNTASSVFDQQTLTATAGQTLFNLGYEYVTGTNAMAVYKNGSRLITGTDFTETSSTSVTLTMAAIAGDEYTFIGGQDVSSSFSSSNVSFTQSGTGATIRSVQTKLRETVSVKDFGAVGDGVADDTAAFTAALAAASVVIAPWTASGYQLNSGFTVPTGKVLVGGHVETSSFGSSTAGDRGTVKLIANQASFTGTAVVTLAARSGMAGITVYGKSGVDPIVIGSNTALAHVRAIKGRYGLNVSNAGGIVLTDVQADGNTVGMFSSAAGTDIQAVGCVFSNSTSDGVLLNNGAGQVAFTNTRFEWNAGAGIKLFDVTGGVTFDGSCVFDRNGEPAARIQGATSNVIFGDGIRYSRNGATTSNAALKVHITLEGTGSNIKIGKGHWIATSITDDGLGTVLPNYVATNAGAYSEVFLRDQPAAQALGVFYDATTKSTLQRNPVVQVQEATLTTAATGTTVIPVDDSIPQSTEGDQYLTCAITPRRATNLLVVDFEVPLSNSVTTWLIAALFRDSLSDALAVAAEYGSSATGEVWLKGSVTVVAGSTAATTFKLRCGGGAAGTTTVNGHGTFRYFGGAMKTTIRVTEYEAY